MVQWLENCPAAFKVSAADAQRKDALCTELWPVTLGMRIVGAMPVSTDRRTGEHMLKVASPTFALFALEYLAILVALAFVHHHHFVEIQRHTFDMAMPVVLLLLYDVLIVVTPWFCWMEARAFARHLNEWTRLQLYSSELNFTPYSDRTAQAEFELVTRTPLRLGLRRRAIVLACAVTVGSVLLETAYAVVEGDSSMIGSLATSVYQDLLRSLICVRWHLQCMALVAISRQMLERLKMEISQANSARVLNYRLLWLRLSAQTRDTGTACCYTHGFYLIYLFVTLMLAVYQPATSSVERDNVPITLLEGAIIASSLFVFCDSAHRATAHVGGEWLAFLLRVRSSHHREVRMQLGDFLETCSTHAPVITLGDYVVVNRALLISMTSAMITYLVVLVQFKMASVENDGLSKHGPNGTALKAP